MTNTEYKEAMTIWIEERIAIMTAEGMAEYHAERYATQLWNQYRSNHRLYMNEQERLIE